MTQRENPGVVDFVRDEHGEPTHQKTVQRIFEMALDMGAQLIAQCLNEAKVPIWGYTGTWTYPYITRLLRDPSVIGTRVFKEDREFQTIDKNKKHKKVHRKVEIGRKVGNFKAAITLDLWTRVQAKIAERKEKRNIGGAVGGPNTQRNFVIPYANLFRGLLKCPCGHSLQWHYRPVERGTYHRLVVDPNGKEHETADACGRHPDWNVSGDTIRRRINDGWPGWSWKEREPGMTNTKPYYICSVVKDKRCTMGKPGDAVDPLRKSL